MANTTLGKVCVTPKGEFDASVTYEALDVIRHESASYIVKRSCKGVTPVDGDDYMLLAAGDGIDGEIYEIVQLLSSAVSYSKNATFDTLVPIDSTAICFGYLDYVGTQFAIARLSGNNPLLRLCNIAIPTVTQQALCVNAGVLTFAADGSTACELTYISRHTLKNNAVATSEPTSLTIGPLYMMRKITK